MGGPDLMETVQLVARGLGVRDGRITFHIEASKVVLVTTENRHHLMSLQGLMERPAPLTGEERGRS